MSELISSVVHGAAAAIRCTGRLQWRQGGVADGPQGPSGVFIVAHLRPPPMSVLLSLAAIELLLAEGCIV